MSESESESESGESVGWRWRPPRAFEPFPDNGGWFNLQWDEKEKTRISVKVDKWMKKTKLNCDARENRWDESSAEGCNLVSMDKKKGWNMTLCKHSHQPINPSSTNWKYLFNSFPVMFNQLWTSKKGASEIVSWNDETFIANPTTTTTDRKWYVLG